MIWFGGKGSFFLHDTSNRELFKRKRRFFSHGCIRVDRALSFASIPLARDGWDLARVEAEVAECMTQTVPISEKLPLFVTYFAAEPSLSGGVRFREDMYRRDPLTIPVYSRTDPEEAHASRVLAASSALAGAVAPEGCAS